MKNCFGVWKTASALIGNGKTLLPWQEFHFCKVHSCGKQSKTNSSLFCCFSFVCDKKKTGLKSVQRLLFLTNIFDVWLSNFINGILQLCTRATDTATDQESTSMSKIHQPAFVPFFALNLNLANTLYSNSSFFLSVSNANKVKDLFQTCVGWPLILTQRNASHWHVRAGKKQLGLHGCYSAPDNFCAMLAIPSLWSDPPKLELSWRLWLAQISILSVVLIIFCKVRRLMKQGA